MEAAVLSDLHSDHWRGTGNILDLLHFNPEKTDAVFVAGDAASGASLVVRAMASGRKIAAQVDKFLNK